MEIIKHTEQKISFNSTFMCWLTRHAMMKKKNKIKKTCEIPKMYILMLWWKDKEDSPYYISPWVQTYNTALAHTL